MDQCGQLADTHDKWDLLAALTHAAEEFGLSHRTLGVLKALMTFFPDRGIPAEPDSAVVFPSNRKLMERLNGMPESTLRRHLASLTSIGIVSRKNSPNRKRYARRASGNCQLAFGFDLSPLARHAGQIFDAALTAKSQAEYLALLRENVAVLRQKLIEATSGQAEDLLESVRKLLRRKPCKDALSQAAEALQAEIAALPAAEEQSPPTLPATGLSDSGSQNERHIQDSDKSVFDSEEHMAADKKNKTQSHPAAKGSAEKGVELADVLRACHEFQSFFPGQLQNWQQADRVAETLSPMMGIDMPVLSDARAAMGRKDAATAVFCILEKMGTIRSPGAYLRRLAQKARNGQFSTAPMLQALLNGPVQQPIAS
ncbi:hypothetical protein RA19_01020 [Leisingera sp. ANG-M1]|nr:plasmid replication protein RepC [Leisingera sp. ANG-M1]KIC12751.1 hypothetical protein RA19_01020 [Leisingera sp. ANG-M1]